MLYTKQTIVVTFMREYRARRSASSAQPRPRLEVNRDKTFYPGTEYATTRRSRWKVNPCKFGAIAVCYVFEKLNQCVRIGWRGQIANGSIDRSPVTRNRFINS